MVDKSHLICTLELLSQDLDIDASDLDDDDYDAIDNAERLYDIQKEFNQ